MSFFDAPALVSLSFLVALLAISLLAIGRLTALAWLAWRAPGSRARSITRLADTALCLMLATLATGAARAGSGTVPPIVTFICSMALPLAVMTLTGLAVRALRPARARCLAPGARVPRVARIVHGPRPGSRAEHRGMIGSIVLAGLMLAPLLLSLPGR